jgi:HAD superfamily hydrolase (TIGR01662 family)
VQAIESSVLPRLRRLGVANSSLQKQGTQTVEKTIYIIKGAPGCGKTTTANKLVGEQNVFEADKFPEWWKTGIYKYVVDKTLIKASHDWCQSQVDDAMALGISPIAVSNNTTEQRDWLPYTQLGSKHSYTCIFINCDGILLPDGTSPPDVHNVPMGVKLSRIAKQKRFVAPIKHQWNPYTDKDESKPKLVIFDRDNTLVRNPNGGIPDIKNGFEKIYTSVSHAIKLKDTGNLVAIASNNAGITFGSKGEPHKTEDELLQEAYKINQWIQPDIQLYCPDINGNECWILLPNKKDFIKVNRQHESYSWMQPFRKPGAGMLEYIMHHFDGQFGDIEFIGDDYEKDLLAASSAGIPFTHVWQIANK